MREHFGNDLGISSWHCHTSWDVFAMILGIFLPMVIFCPLTKFGVYWPHHVNLSVPLLGHKSFNIRQWVNFKLIFCTSVDESCMESCLLGKTLTHCGLGGLNEILDKYFSSQLQSLNLTDDKSTLATSRYLTQCWPSFLPPYGITRP